MDTINFRINELAIRFFDGNNSKFAKAMATSEANIRNYRKSTVPKIDFIMSLCKKIEISYEWLIDGAGEMLKKDVADASNVVDEPIELYGLFKNDKDLLEVQRKLIHIYESRIRELEAEVEKLKGQKKHYAPN